MSRGVPSFRGSCRPWPWYSRAISFWAELLRQMGPKTGLGCNIFKHISLLLYLTIAISSSSLDALDPPQFAESDDISLMRFGDENWHRLHHLPPDYPIGKWSDFSWVSAFREQAVFIFLAQYEDFEHLVLNNRFDQSTSPFNIHILQTISARESVCLSVVHRGFLKSTQSQTFSQSF